jgi:hypothetical protein
MTREKTDARVIRVIALTFRQPVRLEPDVGDIEFARHHDLVPSAVTLPAKI